MTFTWNDPACSVAGGPLVIRLRNFVWGRTNQVLIDFRERHHARLWYRLGLARASIRAADDYWRSLL